MLQMRKAIIAVVGDASLNPYDEKYELAEKLGKVLIENGYRIITGGLGGIMEAVSKGARNSKDYRDGDIIGLLPGFDPNVSNEYTDIILPTGMDIARNIIIGNASALIAIGGGAGTLAEIAFAWMLKRLIIAYEVEGWSGKLANTRVDDRIRYDNIEDDKVYGVKSEKEVMKLLTRLLLKFNKWHQGGKKSTKKFGGYLDSF